MFKASHTTPVFATSARDEAFETWQDAETFVWIHWNGFLAADDASRADAFASYVAALDAEEQAAAELALLSEIDARGT
jgi:hypothetical protein